jgi:hypothetical protein
LFPSKFTGRHCFTIFLCFNLSSVWYHIQMSNFRADIPTSMYYVLHIDCACHMWDVNPSFVLWMFEVKAASHLVSVKANMITNLFMFVELFLYHSD